MLKIVNIKHKTQLAVKKKKSDITIDQLNAGSAWDFDFKESEVSRCRG